MGGRKKLKDPGAVVIPCHDIGLPAMHVYLPDMADLSPDNETIQGRGGKGHAAFIEEDRPEVGIISSHFYIVIVVIASQQQVR
jgi:hypothetical protein